MDDPALFMPHLEFTQNLGLTPRLGIRHKLIRPYTPRHNGKVERSHREDQRRFCATHRFWSLDDFGRQLAAWQSRSNNRPMRPLNWLSPRQILSSFNVQYV